MNSLLAGKKNVCIIGAGIGGLTSGVLLLNKGYNVHIFEKENFIGGRALSFQGNTLTEETYRQLLSKFHMSLPFAEPSLETIFAKKMLDGYTLDLGFHIVGGEVVSILKDIFTPLGMQVDVLGSRLGAIHEHGFQYPFLSTSDKIKMLPQILRLLSAGETTMKKLDTVSMTEMIHRYGKGKMKLVLELFSRVISTVNNLDVISAGEMLRSQKSLLKGATPVGYPKQGLSTISNMLAECFRQNGGHLHLNTPVTKILIDDGVATGIVAGGAVHSFTNVISNILVQDLFTLASEQHFPAEYVKTLKSLEGTASLCAYYSLQHIEPTLLGKTFLFIERNAGVEGNDAVGMIDFITAIPDAGLAPPSHHLVQSYIICTPKEAKTENILIHLREILDKQLAYLIPDYQSHLHWAIYPAIWQLDGVAKTITNAKPEIQTPVKQLYLIGDCVKAPGVGINCVLNSAKMIQTLLSHI